MAAEGAVILTGGSTGIGAATAKALAKAGREIINLDIKEAVSYTHLTLPTINSE